MNQFFAVIAESIRTIRSQPVMSFLTIIMIAGMCVAVILTTGRTVGAEQSVLSTLDSAGTKSIVVKATPESGLDSTVISRIKVLEGVGWVAGFGPVKDVRNSLLPEGALLPLRVGYGSDLATLGSVPSEVVGPVAYASKDALGQLGVIGNSGGLVDPVTGETKSLMGEMEIPTYLSFLEPVLVSPEDHDGPVGPVDTLVVIAATPDLVDPLLASMRPLLAVDDPSQIRVSTSSELAAIRSVIDGQLGEFGRNLVLGVFSITTLLVASTLYTLVMLRRRDFGRRRALGATQSLIVSLLLCQTALLSAVGAGLGCLVSGIALSLAGDPWPPGTYFVAVSVLAVVAGTLAGIVPAISAARRDPLRELRVP